MSAPNARYWLTDKSVEKFVQAVILKQKQSGCDGTDPHCQNAQAHWIGIAPQTWNSFLRGKRPISVSQHRRFVSKFGDETMDEVRALSLSGPPHAAQKTTSNKTPNNLNEEFFGKDRIKAVEKAAERLCSLTTKMQRRAVLCIHGEGGLGKTQQVEEITKFLKKTEQFGERIWVDLRAHNSVAAPLSPEEALRAVLLEMTQDEALLDKLTCNSDGVLYSTSEILENYRKLYLKKLVDNIFIIVLDNAAHESSPAVKLEKEEWEKSPLHWLIPTIPTKSCFIITSRGDFLFHFLRADEQEKLARWSPDDVAAQIEYLFRESKTLDDLRCDKADVPGRIAGVSAGLPLVAKMLLLYMKTKAEHGPASWRLVLDEITKNMETASDAVNAALVLCGRGGGKLNGMGESLFNKVLRLSVFPGDFDAVGAAFLWEDDCLSHATDNLENLVSAYGVIQKQKPTAMMRQRYRMHDYIRDAAFHMLKGRPNSDKELARLGECRAIYYTGLVAAANTLTINSDLDPNELNLHKHIEGELENVRKLAENHREYPIAMARELIDSEEANLDAILEDLVAIAKAMPARVPCPTETARAILVLVPAVATRACDFFVAAGKRLEWIENGLQMRPASLKEAVLMNAKGLALRHLNRPQEAEEAFEKARCLFAKVKFHRYSAWGTACSEGNLGNLAQQKAGAAFEAKKFSEEKMYLNQALKHHRKAWENSVEAEDLIGKAQDLGNQAIVELQLWRHAWWKKPDVDIKSSDSQWQDAMLKYEQRIEIARRTDVNDLRGAANGEGNAANGKLERYCLGAGEDTALEAEIEAHLEKALRLHKLVGNVRGEAACLGNRGRSKIIMSIARGVPLEGCSLEKVKSDFAKCAELFKKQGDTDGLETALVNRSLVESVLVNGFKKRARFERIRFSVECLLQLKAHLADKYGKLLPAPLTGDHETILKAKLLCLELVVECIKLKLNSANTHP